MSESITVDVFMLLYYRICFWISFSYVYLYTQNLQLTFMNIFYIERDKM